MSLDWVRMGPWAIKSGDFCIAKCNVAGVPKYMLYRGDRFVGTFGDAQSAKDRAENIVKEV